MDSYLKHIITSSFLAVVILSLGTSSSVSAAGKGFNQPLATQYNCPDSSPLNMGPVLIAPQFYEVSQTDTSPPLKTASSKSSFGQNAGAGAGAGAGGGFNSWGCWMSTCTKCLRREIRSNGVHTWSACVQWTEYPCKRCLIP